MFLLHLSVSVNLYQKLINSSFSDDKYTWTATSESSAASPERALVEGELLERAREAALRPLLLPRLLLPRLLLPRGLRRAGAGAGLHVRFTGISAPDVPLFVDFLRFFTNRTCF